jgi:acetoin utilization deacetylase AcuC-like enzyme
VQPLWFRHESSLAHDIPGHPERPDRIRALEAAMARNEWFGASLLSAPEVDRGLLELVHPARYVLGLQELCAAGGGMIDADTPARAMGFCFFGNVAVAARRATTAHGVERVLILDWDVHHGNGTEAIFARDSDVLFVSIHESPLYPGTGPASYLGEGAGEGYNVNLPVPGGSGDDVFVSLVEHVVAPLALAWEPQLVLVSAGFDAHRDDPLASCRVSEAGFAAMTAAVRSAADAVGAPVGLVLEGGYDLGALAGSMTALMPVLVDESTPAVEGVARHPLAAEAAARLAPHWPTAWASG